MEKIAEIFSQNEDKYKPTNISKPLVECDVGFLMATDPDLDVQRLKQHKESYLKNLTRDNVQVLFNKIWELPTERRDGDIVVKLAAGLYKLPRAKRLPKPRVPTKWEQFAKVKGIQKKRKNTSKLSWDDQLRKWVPLYGFRRAQAQREKDWVLEVPQNADPMEDQFAKKADAKTERVAKNELQRLRNIAKARKVKIPRGGVAVGVVENGTAKELQAAVTISRASTASMGRFQRRLPGEKDARDVAAITPGKPQQQGRKRKASSGPITITQEVANTLAVADAVLAKKPKIDLDKAVNRHINTEQLDRSEEKRTKPLAGRSGKKRSKQQGGNARGSGSGKKPKAGAGSRKLGNSGRKRR